MNKPMKLCKRGHDMAKSRKKAKDGHTFCSECAREYAKEYHKKHPEYQKRYCRAYQKTHPRKYYHIKRNYGLEQEQVIEIMESQHYKCAICDIPFNETQACIDHNHETNNVRGILCRTCNTGIGSLKNSVKILQSAIKYLNKADVN